MNMQSLVLPQGTTSGLQGLSDNFSFHASPERFITQQLNLISASDPSTILSRKPIRAKILNRNVAVLSSYDHLSQVLGAVKSHHGEDISSAYEAEPAYRELMTQFFPPPNLLLAHPQDHGELRELWEKRMIDLLLPAIRDGGKVESVVRPFFDGLHGKTVDLYETMKNLSWSLILNFFLYLDPSDPDFKTIAALHEDLLRGQFSLFPVSVNFGFWQSPRKKGIEARKRLQQIFTERLELKRVSCPFATGEEASPDKPVQELRDHLLMFTSSLAVKAMTSLLTAFFLNLFIGPAKNLVAEDVKLHNDDAFSGTSSTVLRDVLMETERLSPPIIGVMRRATRESIIKSDKSDANSADTLIPSGWDVWLYFVGAGRDPSVFGADYDRFKVDRYMNNTVAQPPAFGLGSKTCLGKGFTREVVALVADVLVRKMKLKADLTTAQLPTGLQAWLGWKRESEVTVHDWATDLKQLPTQRPSNPVLVRIVTGDSG